MDQKVALKELDRYEKLPSASAESGVIRNYIEWLVTFHGLKRQKISLISNIQKKF